MRKQIVAVILFALACPMLRATDTSKFFTSVSPSLKKFLVDHPPAMKVLTNALAEAFSSRTVGLYYFYCSDDPNERRGRHFYPKQVGMPDVMIFVAEDSYPVDEFINVLYETLNSEGEKRFERLTQKAAAGTLSRADFVKGILKIEFKALMRTRDLLLHLGLSKKEMEESHFYQYFVNTPTDFDGFLTYLKSVFPPNRVMEKYESEYDSLRKPGQ